MLCLSVNFQAYRGKHAIIVQKSCPAPLATFQQAKSTLGEELVKAMEEQGYSAPTPIQAKPLRNRSKRWNRFFFFWGGWWRRIWHVKKSDELSIFLAKLKNETLKLTPWIPLFGGPSVANRSTWTWLDSCSQDGKWKDQRQLGEDSMLYNINIWWFLIFRYLKDSESINHSRTIYEATWPCSTVLSARLFASSDGSHCQTRSVQKPWEAQNWTWCWDQGSLNLLISSIIFIYCPFWSSVDVWNCLDIFGIPDLQSSSDSAWA